MRVGAATIADGIPEEKPFGPSSTAGDTTWPAIETPITTCVADRDPGALLLLPRDLTSDHIAATPGYNARLNRACC
jgi:hypothetical protein